jgi:hypothetical protein
VSAAVADLRWCLEQALGRHPGDDAAAMALADRMATFLNPGHVTIGAAMPSIVLPHILSAEPEAEAPTPVVLSSRADGESLADPSFEVCAPMGAPEVAGDELPASPGLPEDGPTREDGRSSPVMPATSELQPPAPDVAAAPAPPARKRAAARTDLPLTDGERRTLVALIRVTAPGTTMHWSAALKATGIGKPGPAACMLKRVQSKGYVSFSSEGPSRYVRVIRDLAGDPIRSAPAGSRIEHREGLPVPVTICPPRHARGSVQTQFER